MKIPSRAALMYRESDRVDPVGSTVIATEKCICVQVRIGSGLAARLLCLSPSVSRAADDKSDEKWAPLGPMIRCYPDLAESVGIAVDDDDRQAVPLPHYGPVWRQFGYDCRMGEAHHPPAIADQVEVARQAAVPVPLIREALVRQRAGLEQLRSDRRLSEFEQRDLQALTAALASLQTWEAS